MLLALDQLSSILGGGERVALRLAALLPEYGFRVSILTLSLHPQSPVLSSPPPCPIYLLPIRRTWDGKALLAALALRRFLKAQSVRLVQTFFESSDLWVGSVAKSVPGMRLIWSRRDMGILRTAKHRVAYRLLARMPDHVFAVSEEVRRYCIQTDRIQPNRITTIYNGVDTGALEGQQPSDARDLQQTTILSLGNIRHVKGHHVLLEAAALVHQKFPDATFAVAGEPIETDYFDALRARTAELGLSGKFHFLGRVNGSQGELSRAGIFVMPSLSEGFSNALVEAMAASLPVVATAVGGNVEAVVDGATGLIVPPGDAPALAEALCELLANAPLGSRMGAAGRERVLGHFTTAAMMNAITCCYRQLLGQKGTAVQRPE